MNEAALYLNSSYSRYFLIPNYLELPDGNFIIFPLIGEEKKIDIAAIISFEITEEQANEYIQAEINQAIELTQNALSNFLDISISPSPDSFIPLNLFNTLLGVTPEQIQDQPELAKEKLHYLFQTIQQILQNSCSEDITKLAEVKTLISSLRQTLQSQGINIGEKIDQIPEQLNKLYLYSQYQSEVKELIEKLQLFAGKIEESAKLIDEKPGQALEHFISNYNQLFYPENKAKQEAEARAEYRKMAEESIERSRQQYPMPSLKFEDLL